MVIIIVVIIIIIIIIMYIRIVRSIEVWPASVYIVR